MREEGENGRREGGRERKMVKSDEWNQTRTRMQRRKIRQEHCALLRPPSLLPFPPPSRRTCAPRARRSLFMAAKDRGERNSPTAREVREEEAARASKMGLEGGREGGKEGGRAWSEKDECGRGCRKRVGTSMRQDGLKG